MVQFSDLTLKLVVQGKRAELKVKFKILGYMYMYVYMHVYIYMYAKVLNSYYGLGDIYAVCYFFFWFIFIGCRLLFSYVFMEVG